MFVLGLICMGSNVAAMLIAPNHVSPAFILIGGLMMALANE